MNTVSVSDLMRELQAGEEARAKLPQLQEQIKSMQQNMDNIYRHNQELELSIINYKDTIDMLSSRIRSLEVERDDAGFRELEAQDKLNAVLQTLRGIQLDVGEAVAHIDPPKPEPIAQQTVQNAAVPMTKEPGVVPVSLGERAADPTVQAAPTETGGNATTGVKTTENASRPTTTEQLSSLGQSESGPTALLTDGPSSGVQSPGVNAPANALPSSGQSDANPSAPSTAQTQPFASGAVAEQSQPAPSTNEYRPFVGQYSGADAAEPNAGRSYHEKPDVMSWSDWQASGGEKPYWL